jgi:Tfp pilus assembly protein PilF
MPSVTSSFASANLMRIFLFSLFALLPFLTGCATPSLNHSITPSLPVPFIAQKPNYCGPSALAMLANYYGHPVTQDEIASAIYLPEIRGTLTTDLASYAQRFNLWVRQYRGNDPDLRQKLTAGVPLLVLGKLGNNIHYFVVLGFDRNTDTVTVHSDVRPHLEMRREDFERYWNRAGRWTLLVCPPDRATWRLTADEHNDLGVFHERHGELTKAGGQYRLAIDLRPKTATYHLNLGNILLKQQLPEQAISAFRQAVRLAPGNADALNNLAWACCEAGANLDEAAASCRQAIKLNPSHRAYYLDTLGSVLLKQGDAGAAVTAFEEAMQATTDRQASLRDGIQQRLTTARALVKE